MRNFTREIFYIALFVLILFGCTQSSTSIHDKSFPFSIDLVTIDGLKINSSAFTNEGQIVLIDFWNIHCGPCLKMFDAVRDNFDEWNRKTNFKIIAVAAQEQDEKTIELIKQKKWPIEIYFDPGYNLFRELSKYYNKNDIQFSFPTIFVFDKEWIMIEKLRGAKQKFKEGYGPPKEGEKLTADMLEIDLDHYYNLYQELQNK